MFSKLLTGMAVVCRGVGYGAIVVLSLHRAAAEAPFYVMILTAETLEIIAVVWRRFSKPSSPTSPSTTESIPE